MKDQATEASMHPFDVRRFDGPAAALDEGVNVRPRSVQKVERMAELDGLRGCFFERVNRQHQNKSGFVVRRFSCAFEAGFQQRIAVNAAVRVAAVRRVEHKATDTSEPGGRQHIAQARGVAADDLSVTGCFSTVRPSEVGFCAFNHFRVNINANCAASTEGGFDEKPARSRHRVHNRAVVERSCGKVHRQTSQHGVKADGFEKRAFGCPALAV